LHPVYRGRIAGDAAGLCASEKSSRAILSLPVYPQLAEDAIG
jgi:hypothetical protein